ncbi:MAG: hypothetical protein ACREN8_12270 [Candidatus Dormibacteraceae bacterium]
MSNIEIPKLLVPRCSVPWGACPEHGRTISSGGKRSWCRKCDFLWEYDRLARPCQEWAFWRLIDFEGSEALLCYGHFVAARQGMVGARLILLADESIQLETPS